MDKRKFDVRSALLFNTLQIGLHDQQLENITAFLKAFEYGIVSLAIM